MHAQTHFDDAPHEGIFDRVTMESPRGQMTTLCGEVPYQQRGFHWSFVTGQVERVTGTTGHEAVGTVDGETVARGIVDEILVKYTDVTEVRVGPP